MRFPFRVSPRVTPAFSNTALRGMPSKLLPCWHCPRRPSHAAEHRCRIGLGRSAFQLPFERLAAETRRVRLAARGATRRRKGDVSFHTSQFHTSPSSYPHQTRRIMTSVALMRAAAVWPAFNCISLAELAVMIEVICWAPMEILTSAIRPLMRTESMRPTS